MWPGNEPRLTSGARDGSAGASPPAFILGLGENGYGILRSLVRERVRVTGFFAQPEEFGRYSKYCEAHHLPAALDEEQICRTLIERGERTASHPVLFPTSDYYASFVARHGATLSRHFDFHWVDEQSLSGIVDKARMNGLCREAGVLAPLTHIVGPDEDLVALTHALSFPCLVKPKLTFDGVFPARRKNFIARSRAEFLAFYRAHPRLLGQTVCQEIIEGGDENIFQCTVLIRQSGETGAVFCARKLHQYQPGYGVMCFGRSEENDVLAAQTLRLLRCLRYRGLASLEFKYRATDSCYYFIEMNPRLPWYNALCVDAGVNLPYLAYLDLTGRRRAASFNARQRNGVHWISLRLDVGWFLQSRLAGRVRLLSWLRSMARARSYAWFDWHDLRPFLRATMDLLGNGVRYLRALRAGNP